MKIDPYIDIHSHNMSALSMPGRIILHSYRLGSGDPLPEAPLSMGIHPWDAGGTDEAPRLLAELSGCAVAAVGEIGLDYSHGRGKMQIQEALFRSQLAIAAERHLPVIIHCVRAFEEAFSILKEYRLPGVIFHGYIGSRQQTARVTEAGYYVSAGSASLHSPKTLGSLGIVPREQLFLETDNSGLQIEDIYSAASAALEIPLQDLRQGIYQNFKRLFPSL